MVHRNTDSVSAALLKSLTGVPALAVSALLAYGTVIAEVTSILALSDALLRSSGADLTEGTVAV